MIDWRCTKCGYRPELISPSSHDGWIRIELSAVLHDQVRRSALHTLCSLGCVTSVLIELEISARQSATQNAVDEIDELGDKVDGAIAEGLRVGEEIVFEGPGYRHTLTKIADEEPPEA